MKNILIFALSLKVLFLVSTAEASNTSLDSTSGPVSGRFYDFQRAHEDDHLEEWDTQSNLSSIHYRKKTKDHIGAVLIDHGIIAVPLGYGKFEIVKNGNTIIDRRCPSCGTKYTQLEGCAFSNCYIKIMGKKVDGFDVSSPWMKVGDWLKVYKNKEKLALWRNLAFECRQLSDPPSDYDGF